MKTDDKERDHEPSNYGLVAATNYLFEPQLFRINQFSCDWEISLYFVI